MIRFLSEYFGGDEFVLDYVGKDIIEIMKDLDVYEYSDFVYEIFEDEYLIGYLVKKKMMR